MKINKRCTIKEITLGDQVKGKMIEKGEGLFCEQEGGVRKRIDFEKLGQLFGTSLVAKRQGRPL